MPRPGQGGRKRPREFSLGRNATAFFSTKVSVLRLHLRCRMYCLAIDVFQDAELLISHPAHRCPGMLVYKTLVSIG